MKSKPLGMRKGINSLSQIRGKMSDYFVWLTRCTQIWVWLLATRLLFAMSLSVNASHRS